MTTMTFHLILSVAVAINSEPLHPNKPPIMRVLCLHPNTSSATQLHSSVSQLEERLWTKHGIELVFIDAPLLDVPAITTTATNNTNDDDNENALEESYSAIRRWYIKESIHNKSLLPSTDESQATNNKEKSNTTIQYSGLDASLLHITQIWSRGGANNSNKTDNSTGIEQCLPFQGILGVQQGASVAAMLPLLTTSCNDNEEEAKCLLEGLQFVILVDGTDIVSQQDEENEDCIDDGTCQEMNKENTTNEKEEEDWYVGPNGIESLHVIAETNSHDTRNNDIDAMTKRKSEQLAKRYGPNAKIQYYKPTKKKSSQQHSNSTKLTSPSLHNILGKYLVQQKNKFQSNPQQRALLQIQHQLSRVEQVASVMITEEVKRNPPRCLMAMIGPAAGQGDPFEDGENDDECSNNNGNDETEANSKVKAVVGKTVGAWQGSGRVPGEQGGGAPCPETFLLRQEDRKSTNALVGSS